MNATPPPIRRKATVASFRRWQSMLAELLISPGQWVDIRHGIKKSTAQSCAQDIKNLEYVALRAFQRRYGGQLNATIRRNHGEPDGADYSVWAQWDAQRSGSTGVPS